MSLQIYEIKKESYFNKGSNIFVQLSTNVSFNNIIHKHNFIELVYVVSGTAMHRIGNIEYLVTKGNVIMVDYGVPHSFSFEKGTSFVTYDVLFTPDFFDVSAIDNNEFNSLASSYLFSPLFSDGNIEISKNLLTSNSKEFGELFEKIYLEFKHKETGFQSILRAYLIELIIKFFRDIDKKRHSFTENNQALVQKAIDYMNTSYKTPINLDEIVSDLFISKNYFRQIFKKTTGTSISSYIQKLRIDEACRLLKETQITSIEIARECGFNDIKFFYQTFKKVTGYTPAEYRKHFK